MRGGYGCQQGHSLATGGPLVGDRDQMPVERGAVRCVLFLKCRAGYPRGESVSRTASAEGEDFWILAPQT